MTFKELEKAMRDMINSERLITKDQFPFIVHNMLRELVSSNDITWGSEGEDVFIVSTLVPEHRVPVCGTFSYQEVINEVEYWKLIGIHLYPENKNQTIDEFIDEAYKLFIQKVNDKSNKLIEFKYFLDDHNITIEKFMELANYYNENKNLIHDLMR